VKTLLEAAKDALMLLQSIQYKEQERTGKHDMLPFPETEALQHAIDNPPNYYVICSEGVTRALIEVAWPGASAGGKLRTLNETVIDLDVFESDNPDAKTEFEKLMPEEIFVIKAYDAGEFAAIQKRFSVTHSEWITKDGFEQIEGKDCTITLERRPHYCDRGTILAHVNVKRGGDSLALNLDFADGWPRYYMDEYRGKLECEDWLRKRKQWL
jgi:hypothetical protein